MADDMKAKTKEALLADGKDGITLTIMADRGYYEVYHDGKMIDYGWDRVDVLDNVLDILRPEWFERDK